MAEYEDVSSAVARAAPSYDSRILDVTLSALLLVLVLPLMGFCALLILLTTGGPVLFSHPRVGRDGRMFPCLKFRTMRPDADAAIAAALGESPEHRAQWEAVHKLMRDPRVTPLGAFLRRYCLDELPQLLNVLAGQMSIVGPRPIVTAEIARYGTHFAAYCSVKPGLTGLWQVSGRHALTYDERVRLDAAYVRSRTLALDLRILWRTFPVVLCGLNY